MSTAQAALARAVARLREAGVDDPARDARRLLAHALGVSPARLTLFLPGPLPDDAAARFDDSIARRAARQPVSQITGKRAFFGRDFIVTPDVLDPRPETELLVELALREEGAERILDLGTGSGAILVSVLAEFPAATGCGTDISGAALDIARGNAARHGIGGRARFLRSDWFGSVEGRFDLILSNPPYISGAEMKTLAPEVRDWEPRAALTPGGDGLAAYRCICAGAPEHLSHGGALMVEIGEKQGVAVAALFRAAGFVDVRVHRDLGGRDRVVTGRRP